MKMITPKELERLKNRLIRKPFVYEQVYLEVLDHYAAAYEASDQSLDATIEEQDQEFTNLKIFNFNETYKKELDKQVLRDHLRVLTDLLRMPQLIVTSLIVLLGFYFDDVLFEASNLKLTLFFALAFIPFVILGYIAIKAMKRKQEILWELKTAHFNVMFLSCLIPVNLVHVNSISSAKNSIMDINAPLTVVILLTQVAMCISIIHVTVTNIKPVLAS